MIRKILTSLGLLAGNGPDYSDVRAYASGIRDRLDPDFYRRYYGDLQFLPGDKDLVRHFVKHGLGEGRFPNGRELVAAAERVHGPLPDGFLPEHYRALNVDLRFLTESWQLCEHYLVHGRREGRPYERNDPDLERDYGRLPPDRRAGGFQTFGELLAAKGLYSTSWLAKFSPAEFRLLNADWLPYRPASRLEAVCLFVGSGIDRLAPMAAALALDPAFLRSTRPELAGLSDVDCYVWWLNYGAGQSESPNEAHMLRGLIGQETFPACFRQDAYVRLARNTWPEALGARAAALGHFVRTGFGAGLDGVVEGAGSARLYEQIGDYHLIRGHAEIAWRAFDRSLGLDPYGARCHHKRGDALRALGRAREAVADFVVAARDPGALVWSHIHAAEGLGESGQVEAALEQLARSAPACEPSAPWRAMGHRLLARCFETGTARIRTAYSEGRRAEADRRMEGLLDALARAVVQIDSLPAPLPLPGSGPVVIIASRDLPQCDHYRVVQKYRQLIAGGWTAEIYDQHHPDAYQPALDRARAVIFYRVAAFPPILRAIQYARALGLATIYEIDDLVFDPALYPDPLEAFEGQITHDEHVGLQASVPLFRYAMSLCDIGLASTPALAERMRAVVRTGICHVLRNGFDDRNDPFLERPPRPYSDRAVTIFYGSGTKAHNRDFTELVAPALLEVMGRNARVRLVIAGYLALDARFEPLADRVTQLGFTADVEAYWEVLSGADISLSVLAPTPATDAKSEIKWLEAAMAAVPCVVSPSRTYREILLDGEDVLFAATPEEWSAALERLIADPELRRRIGARARSEAVSRYSLGSAVEVLARFLPAPDALGEDGGASAGGRPVRAATREGGRPERRAAPPARKRRLLLANVFFPPQTQGGATRVVRDNVDHLLDTASDLFDCAILASDNEVEPPYRTRIDSYRGVPVYRISSPREAYMDWRPLDPRMAEPIGRLVRRFEPDLVHFHCIQRLTATAVEVVRSHGVPYLVTAHDAWWISDFQFLMDGDEPVPMPGPDALALPGDRALGATASVARRRRLDALLRGAEATIAVSETFASLYRAAGHEGAIAIPNGVSDFVPVPRRLRPAGRVRLGHVGGRAPHKGGPLIEAVLRQTPFERLSLTLLDYASDMNSVREEVWGTTPVRIVGPVPQGAMAELYADLDVLLAPSLWPESYGLVTREASAAGLWVVAGDRGAIGEDLVEDVNGYRVDVSELAGLRSALKRIDADPARFLAPPPAPPRPLRTARDQGAELVALYAKLLC